MATQYDPIAKDASLNTTENPSRNLADVIAQSLASLIAAMPATVLNNLADVVITLPTDGQTLKYDSVSQKWVNADDAGGHTIVDASGTDMTQRASMQFLDAGVSDDAVNDVTEIEIVQEISAESDLNSAPDGVYQGTWDEDPSDVLTADMVGYGAGTVEDALDGLSGSCTLQSNASGASPETAEYSINGNIGFVWGYFTCHNSTSEEITISDIPDGYLMPQSAIASRCYNTGELILIWVNDLIISTWNHTGSLGVGNKYYFSVPIIKS